MFADILCQCHDLNLTLFLKTKPRPRPCPPGSSQALATCSSLQGLLEQRKGSGEQLPKEQTPQSLSLPGPAGLGVAAQAGAGQAKDGWPPQPSVLSSAETIADDNGLVAFSCNQLHFLPIKRRPRLLTLTDQLPSTALKDSWRNRHK